MIIVLPTIMHTGTFLLIDDVFKWFKHIGCAQEPEGDCVIHCHTTNSFFYEVASCMDKHPVVSPIRHPARVLESFKRRNHLNYRVFREQFGCMADLVEGRDVFYIHIDEPDLRDAELARINNELGLKLKTDWPLVNCVGKTHDIKLTKEMMDEIPQWIMDFYHLTYEAINESASIRN